MLALARENQLKAAVTNVEFLKGEIEYIPLRGDSATRPRPGGSRARSYCGGAAGGGGGAAGTQTHCHG